MSCAFCKVSSVSSYGGCSVLYNHHSNYHLNVKSLVVYVQFTYIQVNIYSPSNAAVFSGSRVGTAPFLSRLFFTFCMRFALEKSRLHIPWVFFGTKASPLSITSFYWSQSTGGNWWKLTRQVSFERQFRRCNNSFSSTLGIEIK